MTPKLEMFDPGELLDSGDESLLKIITYPDVLLDSGDEPLLK